MSIRKREWTNAAGVACAAWQVDYRDSSGKRRSKQFARKKEADAWLTQAAWQVTQGTHTPDSVSITVKQAGALWVARAERENLEQTTIIDYRNMVRLHIVPLLGATKLSQLTTPKVERFRDAMLETRSRAMASKILRALSGILAEAMRQGRVAQNVAANVRIRRNKRDEARAQIPTKAEMKAILEAAATEKCQPIDRPLFVTALFTGLRSSELRGLRWCDVDLKAARLTVCQRADKFGLIGPPKSRAGHRTIPLASIVVTELRKWKLRCPKSELELVFPTGSGTVENHSNLLNRHFWPLQIRAGVCDPVIDDKAEPVVDDDGAPVMDARYSMHALRHCAASLWIEQGVQPKRIQEWMGHSSIQMTFDTYGHLFDQRESDALVMAAVEKEVLG